MKTQIASFISTTSLHCIQLKHLRLFLSCLNLTIEKIINLFFCVGVSKMNVLEFIVRQRWLFAIFLLPISFFYDIFWYLRSKFVLWSGSAPSKHKERVQRVQKQVQKYILIHLDSRGKRWVGGESLFLGF